MPIESVDTADIALKGSDRPQLPARRCDVLAELAIGLAGIAAEARYSFGTPTPEQAGRISVCVHSSFSARQLAAFAIVRELIAAIDSHDGQDILLQGWTQALSFVAEEANWEAIEFSAPWDLAGLVALDCVARRRAFRRDREIWLSRHGCRGRAR